MQGSWHEIGAKRKAAIARKYQLPLIQTHGFPKTRIHFFGKISIQYPSGSLMK